MMATMPTNAKTSSHHHLEYLRAASRKVVIHTAVTVYTTITTIGS